MGARKPPIEIDNRVRGVTSPDLYQADIGDEVALQDCSVDNDILVDGVLEPTYEAEKALVVKSKDGQYKYKVRIGDKTKDKKAFVGVGITEGIYINFKPVADKNYSTVITDGKKAKWEILDFAILETEISYNGIKSTIILEDGANHDNLYFTIKLPDNGTLDIDSGGAVKALYSGSEMGYMPAPFGWDANGKHIECAYTEVPGGIEVDGETYIGLKLTPIITDHVYPLYIDPSFSYSYTDVQCLNVKDTTGWTFDKTGSGKSWSALQPFPTSPILAWRSTAQLLEIYDSARTQGNNPWIEFETDNTTNKKMMRQLFGGNYHLDMLDGMLSRPSPTQFGSLMCSFKEDLGTNNRSGIWPDNATNGQAFNGNISQRNSQLNFIQDDNFDNLADQLLNPGSSPILSKFLVDSNGDQYLCYVGAHASDSTTPAILKLDFTACGYSTTLSPTSGGGDVATFENTGTGEIGLAMIAGGAKNIINESEWTKNGNYVSKFVISGITPIAGSKRQFASINGKLLILGSEMVQVVDGSVLAGAYSGSVNISTLHTDGKAYGVGTETSAQSDIDDYIVDDIFKTNTWLNFGRVEGTNFIVVTTSVGMFALDFTDAENPIFNGYLDDATASGIFSGFTLLTDKNIKEAGGAPGAFGFYTASKLWIYEFDADAPVASNFNPGIGATGVARGTDVYFEVDDAITGVDQSSIDVSIASVAAIINGVGQSGFTVSIAADGSGLGFDININPDDDFAYSQVVSVALHVDDNVGNTLDQNYSFTIESQDVTPPYGGIISAPLDGARTTNAPTITTSGWSGSPTQYNFILSLNSDFSAPIESGWQAGASWLPGTLLPTKMYYVKAQARDASLNESVFTLTNRFFTAFIGNHVEVANSRILSQYKD